MSADEEELERLRKVQEIALAFCAEVDRAVWARDLIRGMIVPYHGDFAGKMVPSTLEALKRWVRDIRAAAEEK